MSYQLWKGCPPFTPMDPQDYDLMLKWDSWSLSEEGVGQGDDREEIQ